MKRWFGFVLVTMAIAFCVGFDVGRAEDPTKWYTLNAPDRSFSVDLPAQPKHMSTQLKTVTGHPYAVDHYLVQQDELAFVVQTAIHPNGTNVIEQRGTAVANAASTMEGGKWLDIKEVAHEGLPALDATGQRRGHAVRIFSVVRGLQIVTLTYTGPPGSAHSAGVDRFIGSLRIKQ